MQYTKLNLFRAWIGENIFQEATFTHFNVTSSEKFDGSTATGAVCLILLLIIIGTIFTYFLKTGKIKATLPHTILKKKNLIPSNISINTYRKDSGLQTMLNKVLENETEQLKTEFRNIRTIVEDEIYPNVTFNIANANKDYNRYKDMVPYDDNIAELKLKTGRLYKLFTKFCYEKKY